MWHFKFVIFIKQDFSTEVCSNHGEKRKHHRYLCIRREEWMLWQCFLTAKIGPINTRICSAHFCKVVLKSFFFYCTNFNKVISQYLMQLEPKESFFCFTLSKDAVTVLVWFTFSLSLALFLCLHPITFFLLTPSTFIYLCLCFCQHPTPNLFISHSPFYFLPRCTEFYFLFCPSLAFRPAPFLTLDVLFSSYISHSLTLLLCLTLNISILVSVL